ncbi:MAG: CcmD family protein [Actinomycetota bacterium]
MPDIQMAPYVLGAYIGAWLILAVYLVFLSVKVSRIKKEIKYLEETVKKR